MKGEGGVAEGSGWRPLRTRPHRSGRLVLGASAFSRLALTHGLVSAGDTLVTMALAGSLFFSISPTAARGRVALYLLLTVAPFAVVAPVLGPALDRSRSGRRTLVAVSAAGRCVACLAMARDLDSALLFPEAFLVLVLSKAYLITKNALVPGTVKDPGELVEANSRLALLAVIAGFAASAPGALLLKIKALGAPWAMRLAAVVFAVAAIASLRLKRQPDDAPLPDTPARPPELKQASILMGASAMAVLRATVGFFTFLVAFAFRRANAPSWQFGAVLALSLLGSFLGAALAPRVRRFVVEERILMVSLVLVLVIGLLGARTGGFVAILVLAAVIGVAASAAKLAFDSIVQRDAQDAARGRAFARFETRFQLAWVLAATVPVVLPIPSRLGMLLIAGAAAVAVFSYSGGRRLLRRGDPGGG